MNDPKRFRHQHRQEEQVEPRHETRGVEFDSVEDILRHDRAQIAPPPDLAARLGASLGAQNPPAAPWWKKWLARW